MDINLQQNKLYSPEIRRYLCVTTYLQDYFSYRQKLDSKFSYEEWANELGFKSRTYMRLLCQGKRTLTKKFIDVFSEYLDFSDEDRNHLTLLSLYDQAKDFDYREIFMNRILAGLVRDEHELDLKDYTEFLSNPNLPVVHLLLSVENFKMTSEKLAILLNKPAESINLYLGTLKKLGLAFDEDGFWLARKKSFKITGDSQNQTLAIFNKNNLKEAESYISRNDIIKRFRSIYFPFNEADALEIDKEIENFLSLLKAKYNRPKSGHDRYFKLNLQMYPVTELLDSN